MNDKTITVDVGEARVTFSSLLDRVEAGEEVVIERDQVAVAKLVSLHDKSKPEFGSMKGVIDFDEGFFDPLPEQELLLWQGSDCPKFLR